MSKRTHFSVEEKYTAVKQCKEGTSSISGMSKDLGISFGAIKTWIRKWEQHGLDGLKESHTNKKYSQAIKQKAVEAHLLEGIPIQKILRSYQISSASVLYTWISKYTSGEVIQLTNPSRGKSNMYYPGRKTTFKERLEIAQFTIANDKDYPLAMETYQVSYNQVYSWVQKYQELGEEALQDRRGRSKRKEELTETERLTLRIKELEAQNERLEIENAIAKKLQEIEQRYQDFR
ncbi:helix-turn-helix domain-containing protein [Listeria rocourtiae]|uniref:helix-turn-helix domain-containing protein n=1 Tax=Listeria rocourtiae TaxID=647910 RepID=UPI003D2F7FD6